jgi:hypothetical protein
MGPSWQPLRAACGQDGSIDILNGIGDRTLAAIAAYSCAGRCCRRRSLSARKFRRDVTLSRERRVCGNRPYISAEIELISPKMGLKGNLEMTPEFPNSSSAIGSNSCISLIKRISPAQRYRLIRRHAGLTCEPHASGQAFACRRRCHRSIP